MRKQRRRDQVCIDPADIPSAELPAFHQIERFFVSSLHCFRKFREVSQNLATLLQISARKFTQHEGMHENQAVVEKRGEARVALAKMFNPDGAVDQYCHNVADRRRGAGSS